MDPEDLSSYFADGTRDAAHEYACLILEAMGSLGDTLATYDGQTINVFGGIPGEKVVVRIIRYRRRRRQYVSGLVVEVLKSSPHRVPAPCPYFGPCSGCQWQHIEYEHQLNLKRAAVDRELKRFPELMDLSAFPTRPSPEAFNYRNHARFTVRDQGSLGFTNRLTRRFVKIDHCMLMTPWINEALEALQDRCQETTQLSIRYGVNTGDWLIQPTLQNSDIRLSTGQSHYREMLLKRPFRIASPSFFQVNTMQAERLAELVRARLQLTGKELLVDAYAGVGVFAVLLAPFALRVVAIEESAAAIRDTAINAMGIDNITFIERKTEDALASMEDRPDVVILDPPRTGCHSDVLNSLVSRAPGRVVYVSCEPETLARDLVVLVRGGYRVVSVEPVDMFPQTHHVECVVTLTWDH